MTNKEPLIKKNGCRRSFIGYYVKILTGHDLVPESQLRANKEDRYTCSVIGRNKTTYEIKVSGHKTW